MTYNTDLMIRVREHIMMHPERHSQHSWGSDDYADPNSCGTTYCIAGWAVVLATGKSLAEGCYELGRTQKCCDDPSCYSLEPDLAARDLLGLDDHEMNNLFYDFNNRTALAKLDALIEKGKNGA